MEEEMTTISVKKMTLKRLADFCHKSLSYDEFLNKLLDVFERERGNEEP